MSEGPAEWIERVLGIELWETQKHIIAAMDKSPAPVEAAHGLEARRRLLDRWATILVRTNPVWPHCDPIADLKHWERLFAAKSEGPCSFYWFGSKAPPKWFQAYAKHEAEAAKRKTIEINCRFSPAELVAIDEAARITPFEWEGLAKATEALRPKSVRCIGMDVAGGGKCSSVTVMRHEDGTLYHEGKDYEVKDGVITALPGGRLWGGKHETVHVSYTLQPAEQPPLHKPQPWNPPVAKRRKR